MNKLLFVVPPGMRELVGDGHWSDTFRPYVPGENIRADSVKGTRFGGADDSQDGGTTASGISTANHPELLGCSLPFRQVVRGKPFGPTLGSPIPHLPYLITHVTITSHKTGKSITVPLLDIGPSKGTNHGIDMTNATVKALGLALSDGVYEVDFEILGGAHYVVG